MTLTSTPSNRSFLWVAVACLLSSAAVAAPSYRITVVPPPPGLEGCIPSAINDLGHIAATCGQHTIFWTPEDGSMEIAVPSGYFIAKSMNNHDVIAGEVTYPDVTRDGVLWDRENGMRVFTPPGPFPWIGEVYAINDDGQVVGAGWGDGSSGTPRHGFTWTEATGLVDPAPAFSNETQVRDVNELGQMTGWGQRERGGQPVVIDAAGNAIRLDVSFCSTNNGQAYSLNDLSQVAGSCYATPNSLHAVIWTGPKHGRDIDGRAESKGSSQAFGVNNAGQVLGMWTGGGSNGHAWETTFYWDRDTKMTSLNQLLDPADPLTPVTQISTWSSMNESGQIATAGEVNGVWQLLLLTPVSNKR